MQRVFDIHNTDVLVTTVGSIDRFFSEYWKQRNDNLTSSQQTIIKKISGLLMIDR